MPRPPVVVLLAAAAAILAPGQPVPPALPSAFTLDGFRDPGYVLVAEDPPGDYVPALGSTAQYQWADLTRLYLATDDDHLYVYADLPDYTAALSSGEIGLALSFPDSDETGMAYDPWRYDSSVAYAFSDSNVGQCGPSLVVPNRPPDILIRGFIKGAPSEPPDSNSGFTILVAHQAGAWLGDDGDWGGYLHPESPNHIAYADISGVELFIPWADLGLDNPTSLSVSFFTASAGRTGVFDSIPPDPQAPPPITTTVLSQLQTVTLPLPAPLSVALGCDAYTVEESGATVPVTAQLYTALTQTVSLSYTTTALTAGSADFTPVTTGTVTFNPGITRQTIQVSITDDTTHEITETFRLSLTNPLTVSLTSPFSATITILDDDDEVVVPPNYLLFVPVVRR